MKKHVTIMDKEYYNTFTVSRPIPGWLEIERERWYILYFTAFSIHVHVCTNTISQSALSLTICFGINGAN